MVLNTASMINVNKDKKRVIKSFNNPVEYKITNYIPIEGDLTGKGVKISILDSGSPIHADLPKKFESVSFVHSDFVDRTGHSTLISGIIGGINKNGVYGFAPNSSLLYGKVLNDKGKGDFNSIVAGVLWSIVKEVDIIVIALGTDHDYTILHDAIIKAKNSGICIFAAAGNDVDSSDYKDIYPSAYEEVFSTACLTKDKSIDEIVRSRADFVMPCKNLYTTYKDGQYLHAKGSSVSAAFFAGISSCLIEDLKKKKYKKEDIPAIIYKTLIKHFK